MKRSEQHKHPNQAPAISSVEEGAQGSTMSVGGALALKAGQFLSDVWSHRNEGKWSDIANTVRSLREHEGFSGLRTMQRLGVLFEGALAASRLGDGQTIHECCQEVRQCINSANEDLQLDDHKKELQRLNGLATGELQFNPEEVAEPSVARPAEPFRWCKATNVPRAIDRLTHDIVELFRSSQADSGVVIYRGHVVPFMEGEVEETVYYASQCPEVVGMMSSTKSVGGLAAFMMVEEGLLKLDCKVSDLMPEWNWQGDGRRHIEVRHLMTHTSGLPGNDFFDCADCTEKPFFGRFDDLTAGGSQHRQVSEIGHFDYSNVGTQLLAPILGRILEQRSRGSLADYIKERIIDPLGMARSQMTFDQAGTVKLFADMQSTCLDFARIGVMIMNGGRWDGKQVMQPETIGSMLSTPADLLQANRRGCGHLYWRDRDSSIIMTLGYLDTSMFIVPELDLVVVRTQEYPPAHGAGEKLKDILRQFCQSQIDPLEDD